MKSLKLMVSMVLLVGCANTTPEYDEIKTLALATNEKIFIGIPSLFALEGTMVRLNEEWLLTPKHNKLLLQLQGYRDGVDVFYHPTCDIALVKEEGVGRSEVGLLYEGQTVYQAGYAIYQGFTVEKGVYLGDIIANGWEKCFMAASTAENSMGLSGGAVYNKDGVLVGVTHGTASGIIKWDNGNAANYPSVFTPLYSVKDWLHELTGEKL